MGYPPEKLDLDPEADFGIDRVERAEMSAISDLPRAAPEAKP
jgi:hypothetical protein